MTADAQSLAPHATLVAEAHVDSPTRLYGRQLRLARTAWLILIAVNVLMLGIATPALYNANLQETLTIARSGLAQLGMTAEGYATLQTGLAVAATLISLGIAVFLFVRRSDDWMVLLVAFVCFTVSPHVFNMLFALGMAQALWRVPVLLQYGVGLTALALLLVTFPTGRFVPAWTRPAFLLFAVLVGVFVGMTIVQKGLSQPVPGLIVCIGLGCIAQVIRYRRTTSAIQRQQFRWIVFGMCVYAPTYVLIILFNTIMPMPQSGAPLVLYEIWGTVFLFIVPVLLFWVTVVFATLHYHLWDVDVLINRTLVYVPLTAILAGLFAGGISLSQKVFVAVTGQTSDVAAALTTLVVVAAFDPLKNGLQRLVERRFKETHDPNVEINQYGEEVQAVVQVLDAEQLAQGFLEKAVRAFDATGGALYLQRDGAARVIRHPTGWEGEVRLRTPLAHGGVEVGRLELGARKNGQDYDDVERATLQTNAERIARALVVIKGI
jgi:hypothetical protein